MTRSPSPRPIAVFAAAAIVLTACGDDAATTDDVDEAIDDAATTSPGGDDPADVTITLLTYDSFPARSEDSPLNDALDAFTAETGITVDTAQAGDAGTMVSAAALTAGNPEGDVMFGIDNTFLSRALNDDVFEPYEADGLDAVDDHLLALTPDGEATPIDYGDVCLNYDVAWYADAGLEPPTSLDDLADEAYAGQLVVTNPATSSPGMAFLLATIDEYGADGWQNYWRDLSDNDLAVADGWNEAYYERFTWAGGGDRPLVVSYGTSPPAEVIYADEELDEAPTGVIDSTCFRQIEYAGILRGTDHPEAAQTLVDFLISPEFQSTLALSLFVYPASTDVELPVEFEDFAIAADAPASVDPAEIDQHRSTWIDEWTDLVLR